MLLGENVCRWRILAHVVGVRYDFLWRGGMGVRDCRAAWEREEEMCWYCWSRESCLNQLTWLGEEQSTMGRGGVVAKRPILHWRLSAPHSASWSAISLPTLSECPLTLSSLMTIHLESWEKRVLRLVTSTG